MGTAYRVLSELRSWPMAVRHLTALKPNKRLHLTLATAAAAAIISCVSQTAYAEPAKTKRQSDASVVDQSGAAQRDSSNRNSRSRRGTRESSIFRAEDIVPDICKGCSS